ncbi:MAG: cupin domain-containing protein [Pseudomonadota bacterium]
MPSIQTRNLFDDIPVKLTEEVFEVLAQGKDVKVERIVSKGHTSPKDGWYDQAQAEWVMLLEGAAELTFEPAEKVQLQRGDQILIPAHLKHRVSWTDPDQETVWLTVFFTECDKPN